MPVVEWKRPQEISPDGEPKMQTDPQNPGDIKQGLLGFDDCWFLGSLLILSTNPELLKNLIYTTFNSFINILLLGVTSYR